MVTKPWQAQKNPKNRKKIVSMGALGVYKCVICLSLPAFLQGGVDQKLKKHWQAQKNQKVQKALVTNPGRLKKINKINSFRIYGGSGGV